MAMFLVLRSHSGPKWRHGAPLEEQDGWLEHAAFMDGLEEAGFVVLGGPLADERVAFAIEAESVAAVRATLARDPWEGTHLTTDSVVPWTIRLDGRRK